MTKIIQLIICIVCGLLFVTNICLFLSAARYRGNAFRFLCLCATALGFTASVFSYLML